MVGKTVFLLACLALTAVVAVTVEDSATQRAEVSHHLIVGERKTGDRLAVTQNVHKDSSWLQVVEDKRTFTVPKNERITQIRALDEKTNGNGATASILSGGIDTNQVTLNFVSKRGHGINFVVEIYARA